MKAQNIRIIICTPTMIGERIDASNPQDGDLNHYSKLIRDIATRHNLQLCDLSRSFQDYLTHNNPENKEKGVLTSDRVHLTDEGNRFLAEQMLEVLIQR